MCGEDNMTLGCCTVWYYCEVDTGCHPLPTVKNASVPQELPSQRGLEASRKVSVCPVLFPHLHQEGLRLPQLVWQLLLT